MWSAILGVANKTRCGQQDWVWSARLGVANKTRCGHKTRVWSARLVVANKTRCDQQDWAWSDKLGVANKPRCGKQHWVWPARLNPSLSIVSQTSMSTRFRQITSRKIVIVLSLFRHYSIIFLCCFNIFYLLAMQLSYEFHVWRQCKIYTRVKLFALLGELKVIVT